MSADSDSSVSIAETASVWLARHDRGLSPQEERDFTLWLAADPRHVAEWDSMAGTWQWFDAAGALPQLAIEAAEIDRRTHTLPSRAPQKSRWLLPSSLAVAASLVLGVFFWENSRSTVQRNEALKDAPTVVLHAAEAKRLVLPDGSVVEVRTGGDVTFDFSNRTRRVHLERGEAFFLVAHDAANPFIVEANGVAVRAVGTAFDLHCEAGAVDLLVTEGRVRAGSPDDVTRETTPMIEAGMGAHISGPPGRPAVETRSVSTAEQDEGLAWRVPRLEFYRAPLNEVLAAFARHTPHRVRLGDPALSSRTVNGTFRADNVEGFLRLAEAILDLRVSREEGGDIVLKAAR